MKNRITQIVLIVFSLAFALRVGTIFTADRLYSMSMSAETGKITVDRGGFLLDISTKLDSTNAELYFKKYEILELSSRARPEAESRDLILKEQLHLLEECINLCPSWPAYHMYYALNLRRMSPNPNLMTRQMILCELKKAADLKPYSGLYRKIYKRFLKIFPSNA